MKTTRTSLPVFIFVITGVLAGCTSFDVKNYPHPAATPSVTHTVGSVVGIEPIWVAEKAYIHLNDQDVTLDSSTGKTCFLGNLGERHKYYDNLICLESQSGNLLWNNYSGVHDEIAVTPNGIFVTYIGPASIRKYDFQNGNFVWRNNQLDGRMGSSYLYFQDGQIEVLFIDDRTVILDTDGKVVRIVDGESVFISQRDEIFIDSGGFAGFQSKKPNMGDVLWTYEDTRVNSAPLFTDDKIFVHRDFSETAYALDRNTGMLLWEIPKVLGNFVYSPNKQVVYALRENGDLLAIDENSGKESVIAKFSPAPFIYFDGVDNCGYQLSYDEKEHILVVYTGDSRQLFAFREK